MTFDSEVELMKVARCHDNAKWDAFPPTNSTELQIGKCVPANCVPPIQAGAAYCHRRLQGGVSPQHQVRGAAASVPRPLGASQGAGPGRGRCQLPRWQRLHRPRDLHPGHRRLPLRLRYGGELCDGPLGRDGFYTPSKGREKIWWLFCFCIL